MESAAVRRDKPFAAGVETRLRSAFPHDTRAQKSKRRVVQLYPRASGLEPQQERAGNPHFLIFPFPVSRTYLERQLIRHFVHTESPCLN